jgi:hypothetical protein
MATTLILGKDLMKVGKCYSMDRNHRKLVFKVLAYDEKLCSYKLQEGGTTLEIFQLEDEEIKSIKELPCEKLS